MNKSILEVVQGENCEIYCFVRNINGHLSSCDDLAVSIYPYGKEPGETGISTADAVVLEDTPTLHKFGQYKYTYSVENTAQVGLWYSLWQGTVGGKAFATIIPFQVLSNDIDTYAEYQDQGLPTLVANSKYLIVLDKITDMAGSKISSSFWFTSRYSPTYSTYEIVMAKIGNLVSEVDEDTCNFLIWEYSKEADSKVMNKTIRNTEWLAFAKSEFVLYKTAITLLDNINLANGIAKSKQLGDMRVEWKDNTDGLKSIIRKMSSRLDDLERILNSGGEFNYKTSLFPQSSILGISLPDRPPFGRSLDYTGGGPILNYKGRRLGTYRDYYSFKP